MRETLKIAVANCDNEFLKSKPIENAIKVLLLMVLFFHFLPSGSL
jgi:hypothetical protein